MSIRVGVNGFGRIGRVFFRTALGASDMEIVGVNDLADAKTLAHLLKHDSVHGTLPAEVKAKGEAIFVNGREIRVLRDQGPGGAAVERARRGHRGGVDRTLHATPPDASKHLQAGAKKVIISAPAKDPDVTLVLGVNDEDVRPGQAPASSPTPPAPPTAWHRWPRCCTTTSASSRASIDRALLHQRPARSSTSRTRTCAAPAPRAVNMIPTTTGAAKASAWCCRS